MILPMKPPQRLRPSRRSVLAWATASVLLRPRAGRAEVEADLQLVLAVDASGSVNAARFALQKQGYAQAFRDTRVVRAIASLPGPSMAVTMMQWTGPSLHVQVVPWTEVHDAGSAGVLADRIDASSRRLFGGGTSISGAIDEARRLLALLPTRAARRVIDVSGDGANNYGRPSWQARDEAVADGIVINGLPISNVEPDLDVHYREQVIGGPGSFMIAIETYDQFAEAIVHKLVTEIAALPGNVKWAGLANVPQPLRPATVASSRAAQKLVLFAG